MSRDNRAGCAPGHRAHSPCGRPLSLTPVQGATSTDSIDGQHMPVERRNARLPRRPVSRGGACRERATSVSNASSSLGKLDDQRGRNECFGRPVRSRAAARRRALPTNCWARAWPNAQVAANAFLPLPPPKSTITSSAIRPISASSSLRAITPSNSVAELDEGRIGAALLDRRQSARELREQPKPKRRAPRRRSSPPIPAAG